MTDGEREYQECQDRLRREKAMMEAQCRLAAPRHTYDPDEHAMREAMRVEQDRRDTVRPLRHGTVVGSGRGFWERLAAEGHAAASTNVVSVSPGMEPIDIDDLDHENRRLGTPDAMSLGRVA
jgi:hypothetical protein